MNRSSPSQHLHIGIASDTGRRRPDEPNQDSMVAVLPNLLHAQPPLLIVADGMGGHFGGATASRFVIDTISKRYRSPWKSDQPGSVLEDCIQDAHAAIRRYAAQNPDFQSMGSTVVAAVLLPDHISVANVGDSRAYLCRGTEIRQLSQDQSFVGDEVRAGRMIPEEVSSHPKRNILTMSLTAKRDTVVCFHAETDWESKDTIVLCTDGLWSVVPDSVIQAVVSEMPPAQAAEKLIELANASLTRDNVSVIVASWYATNAK